MYVITELGSDLCVEWFEGPNFNLSWDLAITKEEGKIGQH